MTTTGWTLERANKLLNSMGFDPINNLVNATTTIEAVDTETRVIYTTNIKKLAAGYDPRKKSVKYTREHVAGLLAKDGYQLIGEYKNLKTHVLIRCPAGHEYVIQMVHFMAGKRCIKCMYAARRTPIDRVKQALRGLGCEYISGDIKNYRSKILARCPNGHEYRISYGHIRRNTHNTGCPHCHNQHRVDNFHNRLKVPLDEGYKYITTPTRIHERCILLCPNGHEWKTDLNGFIHGQCRCPRCQQSSYELKIAGILENHGIEYIANDRTILGNRELDIVVPSLSLAIELCGNYWHSAAYKDKLYHQDKYERCEAAGYRLFTIFSDDLLHFCDRLPDIIRGINRNMVSCVVDHANIDGYRVIFNYPPSCRITNNDTSHSILVVDNRYPPMVLNGVKVGDIPPCRHEFKSGKGNRHAFWDAGYSLYTTGFVIPGNIRHRIIDMMCPTKSHQKQRKIDMEPHDRILYGESAFGRDISDYILSHERYTAAHRRFIETYEYLGTPGTIPKWVFTARLDGNLAAVILMNLPISRSTLLGPDSGRQEATIQRGATTSFAHKHLGSRLIRYACTWMVNNTDKRVFYGYSDPLAGEIGTIYQACGFEYLGASFGAKEMISHPNFRDGEPFSPQNLRRTSCFKKWCKDNNIAVKPEWLKPNGFKDLSAIPSDIKRAWYDWGNNIILEATRIRVPPKGKYVLVLGKDKREQRYLNSLKTYKPKPYPKRS